MQDETTALHSILLENCIIKTSNTSCPRLLSNRDKYGASPKVGNMVLNYQKSAELQNNVSQNWGTDKSNTHQGK